MDSNLPSGTVSFLFTDIEGSTKIAQDHRDIWERVRQRHHAILKRAIENSEGYVFQIIGDAFCAAFHTASAALSAAIDAQHQLQSENWGETRIKVRMGINTGAAQAGVNTDGSGGYTGYTTLVRTQRVMSTAYGEQILVSNTSAELLLGELPAGVTLRDMKEHRLKGLFKPEHLWQVVAPGLTQDFPALQTLNSIPNNLPIQLTSFIGREKEIAEIKKLVEHNRLVTLTGSAGVGKTRHSHQVGGELLGSFENGVWLVELAPISDPDLVPDAVSTVLGVHADEGHPLMNALEVYLQSKSVFLILDNCEHLLEACAQLSDVLLHACPGLKILASSREALGIAGEISYRVPSLALPDKHHLPTLENLTQYDSVRLFIERATAVRPDFVVSNENAPAVVQVCDRLDGIPLAIELAAVRVKGLSVEQISERLDNRFQLLTGGSRTALPRHQTLRATIEWSYDLLSTAERVLFQRLAVFTGDWTLEAAEVVCAQPDPPAGSSAAKPKAGRAIRTSEIIDLLLHLLDKSLIISEVQAGQARYHMLETISQFAGDKLLESGEGETLRARHLEFYLKFAEQAESKLNSNEQLTWLHHLGAEYANLQTALEWAREVGSPQPALRLASATEQLADVQRMLGKGTQAIPLYQQAIEWLRSAETAEKVIEARLHSKIIETVMFLRYRIDSAKFNQLAEVASSSSAYLGPILKDAKNGAPTLEAVHQLEALSAYTGNIRIPVDWDMAEKLAHSAVKMAEKLDAPVELSRALSTLSDVYWSRGLWREIRQIDIQRLALIRDPRFNDMKLRVSILVDTGALLADIGEYSQAITNFIEAESLASQIQSVSQEKLALDLRIRSLIWLDRWDEIISLFEKMRDMQQRYPTEQIGPSCHAIAIIGSIYAMRGEFELAFTRREEASDIMTAISGPSAGWDASQHL